MAKKLKIKLPKRIAGVKIPKAVRKGPIADFLNSSAGQAFIAQTLIAAAGAFALKGGTDRESKPGDLLRHPIDSAKHAAHELGQRAEPSRLSFALNEAMNAFRAALAQDTQTQPPETLNVEQDRLTKKKPTTQKEAFVTPH
jgi:hypothetical protein